MKSRIDLAGAHVMISTVLSMMVAVASVAVMHPLSASAQAPRKLSYELTGKSIHCGLGPALYFDPAMRTAFIVDSTAGAFPIAESQTTIEPSRIKSDGPERFDIALKTQEGETTFRFERKNGIFLQVGGDDVGDQCALANGRANFVATRFDMIREGVCGNDPKPSCTKSLARTCGLHPEPACVRQFASHHNQGRG